MTSKVVVELSIEELNLVRRWASSYRSDYETSHDEAGSWIAHERLEDKINGALVDLVNSTPITAEMFIEATGAPPTHDDLARCNCHSREKGHSQCGWCIQHWKPRFVCGCRS